jgi:hypothetical protein
MPVKPMPSFLVGTFTVNETFDSVEPAADDAENAVQFRRGFYLGDGTGPARAVRSPVSSSTTG